MILPIGRKRKLLILYTFQGSIVLINLDSALKDAAVWEDPDNFRPERHLDKNGQLIENSFFIPFGQGKYPKIKYITNVP